MTMLHWDFTKLSTNNYQTNTHEITQDFTNITIHTDTSHITLVPSSASTCSVVCYEEEKALHSVSVQDGHLSIELAETKEWYDYIGINFQKSTITIYLPERIYGTLSIRSHTGEIDIPSNFEFESIDIFETTGDVACYASATQDISIKATTGDIEVKGLSAQNLDLSVSTGKVTVKDVECKEDVRITVSTGGTNISGMKCQNFISSGNTGSITLKDLIADGKLSIERSTGDVKFEACDAAEILVKTDTGDVKGTLCSEKIFITQTDTGRVNVPQGGTGGKCEIKTDTGDIKISLQQP